MHEVAPKDSLRFFHILINHVLCNGWYEKTIIHKLLIKIQSQSQFSQYNYSQHIEDGLLIMKFTQTH